MCAMGRMYVHDACVYMSVDEPNRCLQSLITPTPHNTPGLRPGPRQQTAAPQGRPAPAALRRAVPRHRLFPAAPPDALPAGGPPFCVLLGVCMCVYGGVGLKSEWALNHKTYDTQTTRPLRPLNPLHPYRSTPSAGGTTSRRSSPSTGSAAAGTPSWCVCMQVSRCTWGWSVCCCLDRGKKQSKIPTPTPFSPPPTTRKRNASPAGPNNNNNHHPPPPCPRYPHPQPQQTESSSSFGSWSWARARRGWSWPWRWNIACGPCFLKVGCIVKLCWCLRASHPPTRPTDTSLLSVYPHPEQDGSTSPSSPRDPTCFRPTTPRRGGSCAGRWPARA